MLTHHSLDQAFFTISGTREDESGSDKQTAVTAALRRVRESGRDATTAVLVYDRAQDVAGAGQAGIPALFAAWGYGAPDQSAGAAAIAESPAGRLRLARRGRRSTPRQPVGQNDRAGLTSAA